MLIWVPLEPLEERYTADWARFFPQVFNSLGVDFVQVDGTPLTTKIESGEFLDIHSRPYFAQSQIQTLIKAIKVGEITDEDTIFFADLWHPGIESLFYIRSLSNAKFKICGVMHAGSYDPWDFLAQAGCRPWASHFEQMIGNSADAIFVGSEWSKVLFSKTFWDRQNGNIHVTGLPLDLEEIRRWKSPLGKLPWVVFPHRLAPEKGVVDMINIMSNVFNRASAHYIKLVITSGSIPKIRDPELARRFSEFYSTYRDRILLKYGLSKPEYYDILSQSTVVLSTARQETFGYGVLEACALGCTPVVPKRLAYVDTLSGDGADYSTYFFSPVGDGTGGASKKIFRYALYPDNCYKFAERYDKTRVIGKMLSIVGVV